MRQRCFITVLVFWFGSPWVHAEAAQAVTLALEELESLEVLVQLNLTPERLAELGSVEARLSERPADDAASVAELEGLMQELTRTGQLTAEFNVRAAEVRGRIAKARAEAAESTEEAFEGVISHFSDEQLKRLYSHLRVSRRRSLDEAGMEKGTSARQERRNVRDQVEKQAPALDLQESSQRQLTRLRAVTPEEAEQRISKLLDVRRQRLSERGFSQELLDRDQADLRDFLIRVRSLEETQFTEQQEKLGEELVAKMQAVAGSQRSPQPLPPHLQKDKRLNSTYSRRSLARWLAEDSTRAAVQRLLGAARAAGK